MLKLTADKIKRALKVIYSGSIKNPEKLYLYIPNYGWMFIEEAIDLSLTDPDVMSFLQKSFNVPTL